MSTPAHSTAFRPPPPSSSLLWRTTTTGLVKRATAVLRATSSSASGLSSHPSLPRHVCCHHSSRACHLVQHSARATHSPCRPSYFALQLVGNMLRRRCHSHAPRRQESKKQQVISRGLDHVPCPDPIVRTHGLCAHSADLWD